MPRDKTGSIVIIVCCYIRHGEALSPIYISICKPVTHTQHLVHACHYKHCGQGSRVNVAVVVGQHTKITL